LLVAGVGLVGGAVAYADEQDDYARTDGDGKFSYAWGDPRLPSGIGIAVALEGGVGGFTDGDVSDTFLNRGQGVWGLRVTLGSHVPIGLDGAYVGTINGIDSLSDSNADLVGTALEFALRWNILPHYRWNPFIFGGAGWQHYDVTNATFTRADEGIADSDDFATFPMGAGISYRDSSGLTVDVRGTFRFALDSDMIIDSFGNDVALHTWSANAGLGYEF
jgi:opacity protein-like surface antigen